MAYDSPYMVLKSYAYDGFVCTFILEMDPEDIYLE